MKKLFIADPALSSFNGHHYAVTESFSKAAEISGIEVIWLVNKSFAIDADNQSRRYKVESTFSMGTYDGYKKPISTIEGKDGSKIITVAKAGYRKLPAASQPWIKNIVNFAHEKFESIALLLRGGEAIVNQCQSKENQSIVKGFPGELYEALKKHQYSNSDGVLFHTCDAFTYRDIVSFFTNKIHYEDWDKMPFFYLSTPYDDLVMPHNKTSIPSNNSIRHLNLLGLIGTRIFLFAENELLAKYLSKLWSLQVKALYIPQQPFSLASNRTLDDGKLHIYYLGSARTEKGFPFVVEAIEKYLATETRQDVCFTLQITPQILGYTYDIAQAVKRLKSNSDTRLNLIENLQTKAEYQSSVLKSDVLLLCYDKERYAVRSSGIVLEALTNGKNIISTKGTFPHFIAGEAGIGIDTIDDFIRGVTTIADNRERYEELAKLRSADILNGNSSTAFCDELTRKKPGTSNHIDFCKKYRKSNSPSSRIEFKTLL